MIKDSSFCLKGSLRSFLIHRCRLKVESQLAELHDTLCKVLTSMDSMKKDLESIQKSLPSKLQKTFGRQLEVFSNDFVETRLSLMR